MAIRERCTLPGHEDDWIDYRERGWTLGDRIRLKDAPDAEFFQMILDRSEDFSLTDAEGQKVHHPGEDGSVEVFSDLDVRMLPWLVISFYKASVEAAALPFEVLKPSEKQ